MPWFATAYRANWAPMGKAEDATRPGNYGAHLWAPSTAMARRIAHERGLGERVIGLRCSESQPYRYASQVLRATTVNGKRKSDSVQLHSLSFLGMLALSSGVATIQQVLGDQGFIHHFCHQQPPGGMRKLIEEVEAIEDRVPGYRKPRGRK